MTENPDWTGFFTGTDPDSDSADDSPFLDDPIEGTVWLLEFVIAVEFLRRGDRTDLTVWDALEEAIGWWIAERATASGRVADADTGDHGTNDPDALGAALSRLAWMFGTDPTFRAELALQQAVRRWCTSMSSLHNGGERFLRTELGAT